MLHYSLDELSIATNFLMEKGKGYHLWCFYGDMGVGKTTLIKFLLNQLGVEDAVSSPSFSIVNEYQNKQGERVYHFDFYRIKSVEEVYDMGYEDYFDSGCLCLIEWPEKIEELLKHEHHLKIFLSIENAQSRTMSIL